MLDSVFGFLLTATLSLFLGTIIGVKMQANVTYSDCMKLGAFQVKETAFVCKEK